MVLVGSLVQNDAIKAIKEEITDIQNKYVESAMENNNLTDENKDVIEFDYSNQCAETNLIGETIHFIKWGQRI